MATSVYRELLRSARLAFQGDTPLITAAQEQARSAFLANASLTPNDPAYEAALTHAREVAKMLRENIVQGTHIGDNMYKLRIHEETERGDNDTIKMPNGQKVVVDGKSCCS